MPYLIGMSLALALLGFFWFVGFDRDRALYPVVLMVVAHYYILFAIMGGRDALPAELIGSAIFIVIAVAGFKKSLWLVAIGLAGHGVFDFFHARMIMDPGVPVWWPAFCGAFDVVAGVALAAIIWKRKQFSQS